MVGDREALLDSNLLLLLVPIDTAAATPIFERLGLTDATIAVLAGEGLTVITVDSGLHEYLERNRMRSLNFNHFRTHLLS